MHLFSQEELEVIRSIRNLNNDQSLDEYECLETYEEMLGIFDRNKDEMYYG